VTALVATYLACAPVPPAVAPVPAGPPTERLPEIAAESSAPMLDGPVPTDLTRDIARLRESGLLVPVRGVRAQGVEDSFDAPRDGSRRHDAVDILAPRGTAVIAAAPGIVLRVGTNTLGGNVVWVGDSATRIVYYYAHLQGFAPSMRAKREVARGDVIGYVGTTGNAPANVPHLHFQVLRTTDWARWWTGTPINPRPFLVDLEVAELARVLFAAAVAAGDRE